MKVSLLSYQLLSQRRGAQERLDSRIYAHLFRVTVKSCQINLRSRQGKANPDQVKLVHNLTEGYEVVSFWHWSRDYTSPLPPLPARKCTLLFLLNEERMSGVIVNW